MTAVERLSLNPNLIKLLISEDKRLWMHHRQPLTPVVGSVVAKKSSSAASTLNFRNSSNTAFARA